LKKAIYILILLVISSLSHGEDFDIIHQNFNNPNIFNLSTAKISNTYIFNSFGNYTFNVFEGRLNINHNYTGTGITSNQTVFRDDENFKMFYIYPLFSNLEIGADQEIVVSSATNTVGWNDLFRIKSLGGLNFKYYDSAKISAFMGYENTKQLNVNLNGLSYRFIANTPEIDIYSNKLKAYGFTQISQLKNKMNSSDLDIGSNISNLSNNGNFYNISAKYKVLNRDFYTLLNQNETQQNSLRVEERGDDKLSVDFSGKYTFNEYFSASGIFAFQNRLVERGYRASDLFSNSPNRILEEKSINASIQTIYKTESLHQETGFEYNFRNEINDLNYLNSINPSDEAVQRSLEKQKDNSSIRGRLTSKTNYTLFSKDSIKINYSTTILRYDTPSLDNNDDRDEFFSILNLEYNYKFNSELLSGLIFESIQNHLVFLKSGRSSSNNWNKIYRLSPYILYKNDDFSMQSQFEVLANYTVYDYESINPSIKSFSYRQIAYKDSIYLKLGNNYNIQLKVSSRLYERGVLYWNDFAESPQNRNIEIFSKMIFFTKPLYNLQLGFGARYFYLQQKNLETIVPGRLNNDFINKIWGPEALIITNFDNGNSVSFQGWMEIRNYNNNYSIIPNFFINCVYFL
jgi:hypothetical protein